MGLQTRERGCQLFIADMKVCLSLQGQDAFYSPNLVLVCDPEDRATYWCGRPCLLVEVLSPTTERIDRGDGGVAYQTMERVRKYLLVDPKRPRVEAWRRTLHKEGKVPLDCLGRELDLGTIYTGLIPHPPP